MASYNKGTGLTAVAVDAVTPVKGIATPTNGRAGYRVKNPLAVVLYVREVPVGSSAPTFADMVTSRINHAEIDPGDVFESGAREFTDVYLCCASGTGNALFEEIL